MDKKIIKFPTPEQSKENYQENIGKYKFGLYNTKMIYEDGTWRQHWFIVLKDRQTNVILEITPYSKYLRYVSKGKSVDYRRPETLRARGSFICLFLNYVLIDKYKEFQITNLKDLKIEHGNRFLQDYSNGEVTKGRKKKNTIEKMIVEVARFYKWIQEVHKNDAKHLIGLQMLEKIEYNNRQTSTFQYYWKTPFQIHVSEKIDEPIFRDIPDKAMWILLKLSKIYYPEITLGLCLQAFAGLRVGEVCNTRQDICPLDGGGFSYRKVGGKLQRFTINLRNKYPMRSDRVDVGSIKKYRQQNVYTNFLPYLEPILKDHIDILNQRTVDKGYYPLIVDNNGMAMTAQNYRKKFKSLVKDYLIDVLINSDDFEMQVFGELLMNRELSTHSLRHWFTVQLVINGEPPHAIAEWRGDDNLDSAMDYIKNKSELLRLHKKVNETIISEIINLEHGI